MRWIRRYAVKMGLAVACLFVLGNAVIFYQNVRSVRLRTQDVAHTQDILGTLSDLLITMDDAETAQRGFALTGREDYLAPYIGAPDKVKVLLVSVQKLTAGNARQKQQIDLLQQLTDEKFAIIERTIQLQRAGDSVGATQSAISDRGKQVMDDIRRTIAAMDTAEEQQLAQRTVDTDQAVQNATITLLLATALDVLLAVMVFTLVQRGLMQRERRAEERERLLREERETRERAEAALATRDTFLSVAAHELRTPLTALSGQMQLMQRRALREHEGDERLLRGLAVALQQTVRLDRLVDALLDVTRIERGRLSIEREPVDLCELVEQIVGEMATSSARHPIVVACAERPVTIEGDRLRLAQVLQNLIGNAIKYSPDGGTIAVAVGKDGDRATLAVRDPGIGIPEDARARIFERFYRVPDARAASAKGLGIGLYLVQEIVALHEGTITVESDPGAGSVFTVTLPLAPVVAGVT